MCFNATASFTAAAALGGIGVATLPFVRDPRERALAALPLGFAVHQLIEGAVWLQAASSPVPVHTPLVEAWLIFAWLVLPVWVPLAAAHAEDDDRRRSWMYVLVFLGIVTGTFLFVTMMVLGTTVSSTQGHLEYQLPLQPAIVPLVPYVIATCGALLLSTRRYVNEFGVLLLIGLVTSSLLATRELSSVWCFFAAVLSLVLLGHHVIEHRRVTSMRLVEG